MLNLSLKRRLGHYLVAAALLGSSLAMAQTEPTLKQIYDEAKAGRVEQAQVMMQQVLVAHPGSGKAHFVQAELYARQGKASLAREALATAEKLTPGLTFAKPEAVTALRAQLAAKNNTQSNIGASSNRDAQMAAPVASAAPFPWGIALALGGGALALFIYMKRKKEASAMSRPMTMPQGVYANQVPQQGGLNGQQGFGMVNQAPQGMNSAMNPGMNNGFGQPQGYGQPQGNGMGGRIMGGLATGLAVGAGVMAAQAIGKSLMGNDTPAGAQPSHASNGGQENLAGNSDMGGQDFGLNDTSSWDDNSSSMASSDGGGDWDS